jgi:hypothetical protein
VSGFQVVAVERKSTRCKHTPRANLSMVRTSENSGAPRPRPEEGHGTGDVLERLRLF